MRACRFCQQEFYISDYSTASILQICTRFLQRSLMLSRQSRATAVQILPRDVVQYLISLQICNRA